MKTYLKNNGFSKQENTYVGVYGVSGGATIDGTVYCTPVGLFTLTLNNVDYLRLVAYRVSNGAFYYQNNLSTSAMSDLTFTDTVIQII